MCRVAREVCCVLSAHVVRVLASLSAHASGLRCVRQPDGTEISPLQYLRVVAGESNGKETTEQQNNTMANKEHSNDQVSVFSPREKV
jgi:hypothetical protein